MVHHRRDTVENVVLCSNCKHSIVLKCPQPINKELFMLSRQNTSLSYEAPLYLTDEHKNDLDDEIIKSETTLARLRSRREEYRLEESFRLSLSVPIRTLPVEVLREIFVFCCCATNGIRANRTGPFATLQTLTLSHVSYHWRRVVLSSSSLWSEISLCLPVPGQSDAVTDNLRVLELYLSRSCTAPLDICLSTLDDPASGEDNEDSGFYSLEDDAFRHMESLASHSCRWRSLIIDCDFLWYLNEYLAFPSLTELTITNAKDYGHVYDPIENFSDLQSLRRVNIAINLDVVDIPWSQITEVELPRGHCGDLRHIAEAGYGIPSITFIEFGTSNRILPDLTFYSLESLSLKDIPKDDDDVLELDVIFSHTACPRLSHLLLQAPAEKGPQFCLESFQIFLASAPLLSVLTLENLRLDSRFFIDCFPYLQNLTQLSILNCRQVSEGKELESYRKKTVNKNVLRLLAYGNTNSNASVSQKLLPSLQSLHLRGRRLELNSVFVDFVATRRSVDTSDANLVEVKLDFRHLHFSMSDEDRLCLKDLCRDGLKIFDCDCVIDGDRRPFLSPRLWLV